MTSGMFFPVHVWRPFLQVVIMGLSSLNLISLPTGLIDRNAQIALAENTQQLGRSRRQAAGVIHNGHCSVTATIAPGSGGKIALSFEMEVPSVTAPSFARLRDTLSPILAPKPSEQSVATRAGIPPAPPAPAASRMAAYAATLFADLFFDGHVDLEVDHPFDAMNGQNVPRTQAVYAVRGTNLGVLRLSGTIEVSADFDGAETQVYVPVTAIAYDDGVTIPFAGYAETALIDAKAQRLSVAMPQMFWELLPDDG